MLTPEHKQAMLAFASTHNGQKLDQKKMLEPNPMVQKVLMVRMASLTPEQEKSLSSVVTPENADAFKVLLPELAELIQKGAGNGAAG